MTILGVTASSIYKANNSFDSISTINAPGGTNSITFSSIPQTYKHLQIRIIGYDFNSYAVSLRYNSTQNNYNTTQAYWNNSTNSGSYQSGSTTAQIYPYWGVGSYANINVIDIYDYASTTKNKSFLSWGSATTSSQSSTIVAFTGGGQATQTAAITDITLSTNATLSALTRISLYGIKA